MESEEVKKSLAYPPSDVILGMGIRSRDYMRRPSDDDGDPVSTPTTPDARLEAFLGNFLKRNPRFFVYLTVVLAALILIALMIAKFTR